MRTAPSPNSHLEFREGLLDVVLGIETEGARDAANHLLFGVGEVAVRVGENDDQLHERFGSRRVALERRDVAEQFDLAHLVLRLLEILLQEGRLFWRTERCQGRVRRNELDDIVLLFVLEVPVSQHRERYTRGYATKEFLVGVPGGLTLHTLEKRASAGLELVKKRLCHGFLVPFHQLRLGIGYVERLYLQFLTALFTTRPVVIAVAPHTRWSRSEVAHTSGRLHRICSRGSGRPPVAADRTELFLPAG